MVVTPEVMFSGKKLPDSHKKPGIITIHRALEVSSNTVISQLMLHEAARAARPLRLRVQVKSFDVVARLVQAGLGIGVLPEAAAAAFSRHMGLRLVALTDRWATRRMFVAVKDYARLSAPAVQLVQHLAGKEPVAA